MAKIDLRAQRPVKSKSIILVYAFVANFFLNVDGWVQITNSGFQISEDIRIQQNLSIEVTTFVSLASFK